MPANTSGQSQKDGGRRGNARRGASSTTPGNSATANQAPNTRTADSTGRTGTNTTTTRNASRSSDQRNTDESTPQPRNNRVLESTVNREESPNAGEERNGKRPADDVDDEQFSTDPGFIGDRVWDEEGIERMRRIRAASSANNPLVY